MALGIPGLALGEVSQDQIKVSNRQVPIIGSQCDTERLELNLETIDLSLSRHWLRDAPIGMLDCLIRVHHLSLNVVFL